MKQLMAKGQNSLIFHVFGYIRYSLFGVLFAVLLLSAVQWYKVVGDSMMPTLHHNQKIIVNNFIYQWSKPKRNEVVIIGMPGDIYYIKRIIAVAGDKVQVKNDILYINGTVTLEPYLNETFIQQHAIKLNEKQNYFTHDFGPFLVPDNHVFVMGDYRTRSSDSREIGFIHEKQLLGRAEFSYWPLSRAGFITQ